jgi:prepilin-type N-terminal cleavage/methylation domain-containing protein
MFNNGPNETPLKTESMRRKGGFTIIEVLMALIVMAIGLSAIGASIATALRITNLSKERSRALSFARLEMEKIQTFGFGSEELSTSGNGKHVFSYPQYYGYYKVRVGKDWNNQSSPDIKKIYMRVYWDDVNNWQNKKKYKARVYMRGTVTQAIH